MSADHGWQLLKCFGVGCGALVVGAAAFMALVWLFTWPGKYEVQFSIWLSRHPRLLNALKVTGIAFMVACVIYIATRLGCLMLEAR